MSIDDISASANIISNFPKPLFKRPLKKRPIFRRGDPGVCSGASYGSVPERLVSGIGNQAVKIPEAEVQDRVKKYFAIEGFVPKENLSYYDKQNKVYLVEPMGITENLRVKPISGKDLGEQVEIVVETYQGDETKLLQTSTYVLGKNENIGFHFISLKSAVSALFFVHFFAVIRLSALL